MIKRLITLLCAWGAMMAVHAQYYGVPVFVEGFDGESFPESWVQQNAATDDAWTLTKKDVAKFSAIEADNAGSAHISVKSKDTYLTLTSPEIDATEFADLQVGFYGYELNYALRGNIDFRFRVSNDDGATWRDLFSSLEGSSFYQNRVGDWYLYRYSLPRELGNSKLRLQFLIDASTAFSNPQGLDGYIDGVFVSRIADNDAAIKGITDYSTSDLRPTSGVFGDSEPITVTVTNSGAAPLSEAVVWYSINGGEEVKETVTFDPALTRGESADYTFDAKADFSTPGAHYTLKVGVRVPYDGDEANNTLTAYVENIVADVPYIPAFVYREDGVEVAGEDGWTAFETNEEYGWEFYTLDEVFWYVEPEDNYIPNDAYLVSRPVRLEKGVNYRLQFAALSDYVTDVDNSMKVYVSADADMKGGLKEIWSDDAIGKENDKDVAVIFSVENDGIYYLGFHSVSPAGAGMMILKDISLYKNVEKDMAIKAILAPEPDKYSYSNAERVRLRVANYGIKDIAAAEAKAIVSLDGKVVIRENLPAIASAKTVDYRLTGKLNLSEAGHLYNLKVEVRLDGDEDPSNDTLTAEIESAVTSVPYIPDFGNQVSKGRDVARWKAEDIDEDGYTFVANGDPMLDAYSFSYGGGAYGFTTVTLPSQNDCLWSRQIQMEGGKEYKLTYCSRIGVVGGGLDLGINLWKVNGDDDRNFAGQVQSTRVTNVDYVEHNVAFKVKEDGVYQLEFAVDGDEPIDYRIYLGNFRVAENFDRDLSIEDIVVPSTYVSEIKSLPVGANIRNNGREVIPSFSLTYSCGKNIVSKEFNNVNLEPNGTYLVYFGEDLDFSGMDAADLKVQLVAEGDQYAGNNVKTIRLQTIAPYSLPYNPLPEESLAQMEVFNLNRDSFRFMTDRSQGVGYMYYSDGATKADDYIASPALQLEAGKPLRFSFSYFVLEGDVTAFDVFAYDVKNDLKVPVISYGAAAQKSMSRYIGYFEVPADGAYQICYRPLDMAGSLFINSSMSVEEATAYPDLRLAGMTYPAVTDAVFGDSERVEVEFYGDSEAGVQCVPFELEAADGRKWYTIYSRYTAKSETDLYKVTFDGVDLSEPGSYQLTCRALVPMDRTPENNEMTFALVSLPVVDVAVEALVSPESDELTDSEAVTVRLSNTGKGYAENVAVKVTVAHGDAAPVVIEGTLTEPLKAGESVDYTLPESLNMFDHGVYVFTIEAVAEGDRNAENNGLTVSVNSTNKKFDVGVVAITAPVDDAFGVDTKISVAVANHGETDIFNVPVKAEVSFEKDTAPVMISGVIAEVPYGETVEYTFPTGVDMSRCGDYSINAYTALPKDADTSNDGLKGTARCLTQDVGVSAIVSPVSGEELGMVDVTVEVTNYGEATVRDIPMSYITGRMPVLATMTGALAPGETRSFTFPVQYEFTGYGKVNLKVSTLLPNDIDIANDAMEMVVINGRTEVDAIRVQAGVTPNPAVDMIRVTAESEIIRVMLYDLNGRLLDRRPGDGTETLIIPLNVPAGHYIVVVETAAGTALTRLIVK